MKKVILAVMAALLTCQPLLALDVAEDLKNAVELQRKSSEDARLNGLLGFGLSIVGYAMIAGNAQPSEKSTYEERRTMSGVGILVTAVGLVLTGLGWWSQMDADTHQAEVNTALLSALEG